MQGEDEAPPEIRRNDSWCGEDEDAFDDTLDSRSAFENAAIGRIQVVRRSKSPPARKHESTSPPAPGWRAKPRPSSVPTASSITDSRQLLLSAPVSAAQAGVRRVRSNENSEKLKKLLLKELQMLQTHQDVAKKETRQSARASSPQHKRGDEPPAGAHRSWDSSLDLPLHDVQARFHGDATVPYDPVPHVHVATVHKERTKRRGPKLASPLPDPPASCSAEAPCSSDLLKEGTSLCHHSLSESDLFAQAADRSATGMQQSDPPCSAAGTGRTGYWSYMPSLSLSNLWSRPSNADSLTTPEQDVPKRAVSPLYRRSHRILCGE
jgi:hypothetical protein